VMSIDPVRVRVGVPEAEIGRVRVGQPATVQIASLGGQSFDGRVDLVAPAADPESRTFPVRIRVPNPQHLLRAGMIAEARIRADATVRALTLPGEAVVRDPQGITQVFVYFPEEQRASARRVEVGSVYGREVEIVSGLRPGDAVVVEGQFRLRDGSRVAARSAPPPAAPAGGRP